MEASEPLVQVRGLRFAYGRRAVLKGVDLDVPRGKVSAILGTSGSGKSTLLQIMGGLLTPSSGKSTMSLSPTSPRTRTISSALALGFATVVFVEAQVMRTNPNRFMGRHFLRDPAGSSPAFGSHPVYRGRVLLTQPAN